MMGAFIPTVIVSLVMLLTPDPNKNAIFDKEEAPVSQAEIEAEAGH